LKTITTKEGEAMGKDKEEKWYEKGQFVVGAITFIAIIIFGTLWIILYALQADTFRKTASIFGVAALLGGGFFSFGCLLGFMFGIPKLRTVVKPTQAGARQVGAPQAGLARMELRQHPSSR
jgi:uncharacterized protein YqhQ